MSVHDDDEFYLALCRDCDVAPWVPKAIWLASFALSLVLLVMTGGLE